MEAPGHVPSVPSPKSGTGRVFDWLGALNKKMMKNICVC